MKSSLREQFGPRLRVKAIARVQSGSPARFLIGMSSPNPDTPAAAMILARHHLPMGQAHRALTRVVRGDDDVVVEVPKVADVAILIDALSQCGLAAQVIDPGNVDVRAVRAMTGYSQDQFALVYGFDVATIRNWEQGRTKPELPARSYLMTIATNPQQVKRLRLQLR